MSSSPEISIFWFRRDLRIHDNVGLFHALQQSNDVLPIFIFDSDILSKLPTDNDARVSFIHACLHSIQNTCIKNGSSLTALHGKPIEIFKILCSQYHITKVFANKDYEPYAQKRDTEITQFLQSQHIQFELFKDQVLFEHNEVLKPNGLPYSIYTPYSQVWKKLLLQQHIPQFASESLLKNLYKQKPQAILTLESIGFTWVECPSPIPHIPIHCIQNYDNTRDFPAIDGTSKLGIHIRFGTVSIRQLIQIAVQHNQTWLNELIWREFFMMILYHYPTVVTSNFKKQYNAIVWRNNEQEFEQWCAGNTGYPIVDAGMRELNQTGHMHNRVRMITASFLTKHLLIDWQWGEAYFAEKLLDFELSSNNGNWQWAAGTGCDAASYFRIFNPYEQTKRFDPKHEYIQTWVPEYNTSTYTKPIVEHTFARGRALQVYGEGLKK